MLLLRLKGLTLTREQSTIMQTPEPNVDLVAVELSLSESQGSRIT